MILVSAVAVVIVNPEVPIFKRFGNIILVSCGTDVNEIEVPTITRFNKSKLIINGDDAIEKVVPIFVINGAENVVKTLLLVNVIEFVACNKLGRERLIT